MKWLIKNTENDERRLVVESDWQEDFDEFLEQLKAGISEFLEETEEGRDILMECNKNFTWLNLFRHQHNRTLLSILREYKINSISIECIRANIFSDGCKTTDNLYEAE